MAALGVWVALALLGLGQGCGVGQECLPQAQCPGFIRQKAAWRATIKGSPEYSSALEALKDLICGSIWDKTVCCACRPDRCVPITSCPAVQEDYAAARRGDKEALSRVQGLVCDKKRRAVCCPQSRTDGPTYLPRLGDCGVAPALKAGRIVGGKDTLEGEVPWAALVGNSRTINERVNGNNYSRPVTRWGCGGILINRWYVLTAAHCQGSTSRTRINMVRLGEWTVAPTNGPKRGPDNTNIPEFQDFPIGRGAVTVHSDYSLVRDSQGKNSIINDIALIRLPEPAQLNNGVQLVCLPIHAQDYRGALGVRNIRGDIEGQNATVVGWGYTTGYDPWRDVEEDQKYVGVGSATQQKLAVPVLTATQCLEQDLRLPISSQVCAGGELGRDSCKGDSGGGLYLQREYEGKDSRTSFLLGIVSYGSKYCGFGRPGMYTRVESFLPWIRASMQP